MTLLLDNKDKLAPYITKETSSYIQIQCPVCGSASPGIKVSKASHAKGAYRCYSNYCESKKIRQALGIEDEKNYHLSPYKTQLQKSVYSAPIKLDKIIPKTELKEPKLIECLDYTPIVPTIHRFANGEKKITIFPYSEKQRVYRLDDVNKKQKQVYLQTLNSEGVWEAGIGNRLWQVYTHGLASSLSNQSSDNQNTILFVEGEATAEYVKNQGIAAITVASPFYNPESLEKLLYVLFTTYRQIENVIAVPDEDEPGYHKANLVCSICHYLKRRAKVQTLSDTLGLSYVPEKGSDLADFKFNKKDLIVL